MNNRNLHSALKAELEKLLEKMESEEITLKSLEKEYGEDKGHTGSFVKGVRNGVISIQLTYYDRQYDESCIKNKTKAPQNKG